MTTKDGHEEGGVQSKCKTWGDSLIVLQVLEWTMASHGVNCGITSEELERSCFGKVRQHGSCGKLI